MQVLFDALQVISITFGAMVLIAIANPAVIPIFLPLAWVFVRVRAYYLTTSRETRRLDGVTRSPVYAMFSATLKGLPTIRAYMIAPRFRKDFLTALELNGSWFMAYLSCSRYELGILLSVLALRCHGRCTNQDIVLCLFSFCSSDLSGKEADISIFVEKA
jgi:ATP-binding cassette, subfamily C (CFTR/MRP), member 1